MNPMLLILGSLVMAGLVLAWRVRETTRPVTLPKIVIPPLGMSTGLLMFLFPPARIPWSWALGAWRLQMLAQYLKLKATPSPSA